MRGEDQESLSQFISSEGNTPACAGKTVLKQVNCALIQKHPRMRGEDC